MCIHSFVAGPKYHSRVRALLQQIDNFPEVAAKAVQVEKKNKKKRKKKKNTQQIENFPEVATNAVQIDVCVCVCVCVCLLVVWLVDR